ncbi:MAG TPA: cytochrome c biogenesis protein ResB [Actinomycetota bacterium]|nr:cytochrome c biogenesis protein ResB [Actinomycetota bacterium]
MTSTLPPTPLSLLRATWRKLRTMRTAIILLLLLAAGASVGSLFPQRPVDSVAVDRWIENNPGWTPIAEKLGLFDVYGAWWFMAIYSLLLVSLVGCLVPRYRAFWRTLRARPYTSAVLDAQPQYMAGTVSVAPDVALHGAERTLRKRRFRLERANGTLAGEKGNWREGGSLVFHTAFLVLLIGMSMGKWFGFTGQVAVVEGERFTDTHVEYDFLEEGRYFNERHTGAQIVVDDFDVSWWPNGVPKDFVSSVRLFENGALVRSEQIRVNSPLTHRGVRFYQLSWGWAPVVRATQGGKVLYDGPTIALSRGGLWRGVVKLPGTKPQQTGVELVFFTDPELRADGTPFDASPEPRDPLLIYQSYVGDLGLDVPQNVYELDPKGLVAADRGGIRPGEAATLTNGVKLEFTGLRQYSVFQVASNPGAPILLAAAVLILVGLIPALYSSRRRIWVRAAPVGDVAKLEIAGHALQRKAAFEEEFKAVVRDIDRGLKTDTGVKT